MKLQTAQQLREDEVRKQVALIQMRMESATPKFSRHHRGRSGKMCQANGHNWPVATENGRFRLEVDDHG